MNSTLSPEVWQALHAGRKSLSKQQQLDLLQAAQASDEQTRALCLLIYYTGCRLSEAIRLKRDHICDQRGFVVLHTLKQRQGKRLRAVPVPQTLIALLLRLTPSADGRLFAYSRWTAARKLKVIFERANITGTQANSRSLRHSYQDRAVAIPVRAVATLLGHTPLINQRCYGDLIGYELADIAQRTWEVV